MANISDYLDWRSDISFEEDPFNEVDNLVLSELIYTEFDGIVPGPGLEQGISIEDVCEKFFSIYSDEEIMEKNSSTKVAPFLMRKMIHTKRYGNMSLTGYVNDIDVDFQSQFSAITFLLGDGTTYVAYRGTDNTIVGWKEDFNMSFLHQTAGQIKAAEYLNENFSGRDVALRVGGHSKGGNFAVYASVFCKESVQDHILQVYSNDGPGFLKETTELEAYQKMQPKIISTIPESSIVGMLLENPLQHRVVKSSQEGAMQHDAMSWEVMANHFVFTDNVSESSLMLDETLKKWIYGLEVEERQQFVDALFDALEATGATTLDELPQSKIMLVNEMTKSLSSLPEEQQQILKDVIVRFAYSSGETIANKAYSKAYSSGESLANNMQEMLSSKMKPYEKKINEFFGIQDKNEKS